MPLYEWKCDCGWSTTEYIPLAEVDERKPASTIHVCPKCKKPTVFQWGGRVGIAVHYPFHNMPDRYRDATKKKERLFHADWGKQESYHQEKQEREAGERRIARDGKKIVIGGR